MADDLRLSKFTILSPEPSQINASFGKLEEVLPTLLREEDLDDYQRRGQEALTLVNGDNDNVGAPATASLLRITGPSAAFAISGFTDGVKGRILVVHNTTSQALTIYDEDSGSTAANRIDCQGSNVVLTGESVALFIYEAVSERWILVAYADSVLGREYSVRATRVTSTFTVGDSADTAIQLNGEDFDNGGFHDNSTNNTRLTIPVAGRYWVAGVIGWQSNATGYRQAKIRKGGSTTMAITSMMPVNGNTTHHFVGTLLDLAAADYLELVGWQNSGGNNSVRSGGNETWFAAYRVGA